MAAIVKNLQGSYTVRTGIDVSGSELNDTIVNGAYPEDSLVGANSIDEYKGHNISISGNEGKDVILNHGYNVTVSGGDGNDSIRNFGSNVRISGNEGSDKFIISGASENNTITDFTEGEDELWFEQGAVTAEIDTYYTKHSVVIKSAETGDTLVRLEGVTSGSSNKIVWYKDDGGTMSTNINWLLANSATTDSDIKNITVKANGKLNNTLDNAIITATTGNNSIQNSGNKITINGGSGNDTIKNSGSDVKINGNDGDDSVNNNGGNNVTIDGVKGSDTVFNSGNDVSIFGGEGKDSIRINAPGTKVTVEGGKGSDTINNSGASNVLFKYTAGDGNDLITGFNSTSTLSIAGAKYSSNVSGDDLIFSVGKEKITLVGANNLSTVNITGIPNTTQPATTAPDTTTAETTTLIITDSTESRVTLKSAVKTVDASSRTTAVKITGNSNANSIVGGSGDDAITGKAGNDTLDGRTGDDTLTGGSGSDLFIYSTGNDVITDYSTGDKVSLATAIASSSLNGSDVILTTKNGSLTIQNSKGKTLNLIDSAGKSYSTIIGGSSSETSLPVNQNTNQNHTQNNSSSTSTTINSGSSTSTVTANSSSSVSSSSNAPVISYIYTGGDQVIDNYISEQKIALGTLPNGYIFGGGNFALTSDNGTLFIQNAYDKVIDFVDGTGNPFAKAYAATNPGVIDGRGIAGFEVIAGSDLGSDFIFAGDGSSSLWGGNGSDSDTLVGGGGTDIFLGSKYAGNDIFVNASATDLIHLGDVLLSDVIATAEVDNAVAVAFNTGNVIMAGSTEPLSAAFILADGSAYRFNHVTKVWQNA